MGRSGVTADTTVNSIRIEANNAEIFDIDNEQITHLAAITPIGTAGLDITVTYDIKRTTL